MLDKLSLPIWRAILKTLTTVPMRFRNRLWWAIWRLM